MPTHTHTHTSAMKTRLEQCSAALESSEIRFRNIIDRSVDGILIVDAVGTIRFANPAAGSLFDRKENELFGQPFGFPVLAGETSELTVVTRKNTETIIEMRVLETEWGGERAFVAGLRDITERKKNEEDLKKAMEQVTRVNRELEQFAYVASHDLQEPLRMVSSYMQLLQKKYQGKLDEKADQYINYAVDGAQRMQALIEGLLKYSRLSRIEFGRVDTSAAFADAVANLTVTIRETGAEITANELPAVWGDRTQLMQLFQNLLSNAIKYRKPGVPPRITVGARQTERGWLFSVKDNGIGIEQQNFEKVFEIFRRLHTKEEVAGTGIGLASCKKIVEQHQGRIWVESTPGEGSTFFFTIPIHLES